MLFLSTSIAAALRLISLVSQIISFVLICYFKKDAPKKLVLV